METLGIAMGIYIDRNEAHKDSWQTSGWFAMLAQVRSKTKRLISRFWTATDAEAMTLDIDDAFDNINYSAMFIRNLNKHDKLGEEL